MPSVVCAGFLALLLGIIVAVVVFGGGVVAIHSSNTENKDERDVFKQVMLVFLITILCSCGTFWGIGSPLMSSYYPSTPRWKPKNEDIVGTWHLTQWSMEKIIEDGYVIPDQKIEFWDDGTFELKNYPNYGYDFEKMESRWELISGSGTWGLEKDINRDWVIIIEFKEKVGYDYDNMYILLSGKNPPYTIYDWIGDPDSGRTITFTKE